MSNTWRYGIQPSTTLCASGVPSGGTSASRNASPSDSRMSGSKVSRASRAPMLGSVPIGLTRISPSPRNASAIATAQTSALRTSVTVLAHACTSWANALTAC